MRPHNTEMDLSIASALYFAARGKGLGYVGQNTTRSPYQTNARVLLSGLGADELFGGYSRHSAAFERAGYTGLASELRLDVSRIGERNLGRDDRVMAHWGREVRFPYLDENLMRWAMALPVWEKCDFGTSGDEPGSGGMEPAKRVLRLLALQLGMDGVAKERKRAVSQPDRVARYGLSFSIYSLRIHVQIQFGARSAKMESGRTKGTTFIS
jgi:asparagine synthetase B (glutamine-hydrolysing)